MNAQALIQLIIAVIENAPKIMQLSAQAIAYGEAAVRAFKKLQANPNATVAEVDALVASILTREALIQAIP